jgi:hypothetical protein
LHVGWQAAIAGSELPVQLVDWVFATPQGRQSRPQAVAVSQLSQPFVPSPSMFL